MDFVVRDTGVGISAEKQAVIFEPFTQADVSVAGTYGGSGLGLAICVGLLEIMGSRLELESQPGRGGVFSFCLELPQAPLPERADEERDALEDVRGLQGVRVLLADDSEMNHMVMSAFLDEFGC